MSIEKTVAEIQPSEEPQKRCSHCNEPVEKVSSNFKGTKFLCSACILAKKAAKDSSDAPSPVHEAPKRGPQQRRSNGAHHAPRGLTLDMVELCAFRAGIAPPQVNALLAEISAAIAGSSTSK